MLSGCFSVINSVIGLTRIGSKKRNYQLIISNGSCKLKIIIEPYVIGGSVNKSVNREFKFLGTFQTFDHDEH